MDAQPAGQRRPLATATRRCPGSHEPKSIPRYHASRILAYRHRRVPWAVGPEPRWPRKSRRFTRPGSAARRIGATRRGRGGSDAPAGRLADRHVGPPGRGLRSGHRQRTVAPMRRTPEPWPGYARAIFRRRAGGRGNASRGAGHRWIAACLSACRVRPTDAIFAEIGASNIMLHIPRAGATPVAPIFRPSHRQGSPDGRRGASRFSRC